MNASDITSRVFEKSGFKGYKSDEVDEYLREVSMEFSQLQRERDELERKLEVLADKIREYRKDEEALKEALLGAHRQGNLLVNEATSRSEVIIKEADEKANSIIGDAEERSQKQINSSNDYARKTIEEANLKASRIVNEANRKSEDIKKKTASEFDVQNQIIVQTAEEAREFRLKLLSVYKEQVEIINQIPDRIESQFVKKTIAESEKNHEPIVEENIQETHENAEVVENMPINEENIVQHEAEIEEDEYQKTVDITDKSDESSDNSLENVELSTPETQNDIENPNDLDISQEIKPPKSLTQEFNAVFKPTKESDDEAFFS